MTDFTPRKPVPRALDVRWIHGSPSAMHNTEPEIQTYAHDEHTYVLRQNKAVHYEAPFMFLLFGEERAVLIDTGATESPEWFPLRRTVDEIVERWLREHPRSDYSLLVLHTHAHGDHVAGDGQFADRPATVLVGGDRETAWSWFGFDRDPAAVARVDLGGRVLECLATPGHHESAVTYYDPRTGWLLTGDTVYPGRLYVQDWSAFVTTVDRLVGFAASKPVTHVVGCHVEMTREPAVDYPVRTTYQPDEPPLEMTVGQLKELAEAVHDIGDSPGRHVFPRFIICHRGAEGA
ncbi:MBL fold metallo-hydrolase [Streptomyces sp. NPDC058964]|uniref:MBL fold metallo-hydrolase n=1 Tax=Streptomyces sp. NPDC058964 TaxID=3346681 RepID=UPI003694B4AB